MQYDVSSAYKAADGLLVAGRVRLKGITVAVGTAGTTAAVIYDNATAAEGKVLMTIGTTAAGYNNIVIPGEGILAEKGLYLDINDADSVTVFYG